MSRKFDESTINNVLDCLIGNVEPIGETNFDNASYENLKVLESVIRSQLDTIQWILPCINNPEYSMKRAGFEAKRFIEEIKYLCETWLRQEI